MKMRWSRWCIGLVVAALLAQCAALSWGQAEKAAPKAPLAKAAPAAKAEPAAKSPSDAVGRFRPLGPGVLKSIDPQRQPMEVVSRKDVVELLAVDPSYDFAKNVEFRRDIWSLDFKFKVVRIVDVDIVQPSGMLQRKPIWYLVYTVTNQGKAWRPSKKNDGTFELQQVDQPVDFAPQFLLESVNTKKWYPDRVIPIAIPAIIEREDPARRLYSTAEIAREGKEQLKPGETLWGVATWEDIDQRTNRFAIYVSGLTNAYEWNDAPGKFKKGDPVGTGRQLARKTLKLNFRRAGDELEVRENQIRYGIPDEVDYQWVYR